MKLINLTPCTLNFYAEDKETELFSLKSEGIAKVKTTEVIINDINGLPCSKVTYGAIEGLPVACDDTVYIVSALTLQALGGERKDVVAPKTDATAVRDEGGRILGVTGFSVI